MGKVKEWIGRVRNFFVEVRQELRKSSWPTRQELVESTIVVILSVVMLSLFVGLSDSLIVTLVRVLLH